MFKGKKFRKIGKIFLFQYRLVHKMTTLCNSRENPCEECICQENGQMECQDAKCGLNKNAEMLKGCVPIFRDNVCCPVDWMCPLPAQAPRLVRPPPLAIGTGGASVRCPPGVNPRRDFQDYIRPPSVNIEEVDKLGSRVSFV